MLPCFRFGSIISDIIMKLLLFRMEKEKPYSPGKVSMLLDRFILAVDLGRWKVVARNAFFG